AEAPANTRFEEITESSSPKYGLPPAATPAQLVKSAVRWLGAPVGGRLKSARSVPIRPELIVLLTLLRIAQDFVGFVDLLKLFFGGLFVLRDIGMMFSRQLAKSGSNLILARFLLDARRCVITTTLHRQRLE